jgi:predicted transcriptional regulator
MSQEIDLTKEDIDNAPEYSLETSNELINPLRSNKADDDTYKEKWEISKLTEKHHAILRLIFLGYTNKEIAQKMNVSPSYVSKLKQSELIKQELNTLQQLIDQDIEDVKKEILKMQPYALQNIKEVIRDGTLRGRKIAPSHILKESNSVLDRGLGTPTQTITTKNLSVHLTRADIEYLKQRAREVEEELDEK